MATANNRQLSTIGGGTALSGRPTASSADWKTALIFFINGQDIKQSSRDLYSRTLKLFFEWTETEGKAIRDLSLSDILEYKDHLFRKGLSSLSVASYITSLRKFYAWAESEKVYPDITKGVKTPRREKAFMKQHLTDEKSTELLSYFRDRSLRDYAIVSLLLRTGLRTIEAIRADVGDITFKRNRRILRIWGKGRDTKDNFVVLTDKAYEPIRAYLATRKGAKPTEPLFISDSHRNEGERLTTRSISRICKEGLKAIGLDGREFTAHSLRHTTAVTILTHGGNREDAQRLLRHASPSPTEIYTASIGEDLRVDRAPEILIDNVF
ncbi:MAG: site-specific integrase [Clostridia bacterium]|nr:site-specific integrase [Clostridia bacterium]